MEIQTKEARIILAIEAIRTSKRLSQRSAAKIYKVPLSTLSDRMAGRIYRPEAKANSLKLTELEEKVIVRNILDMDSRGFAPRLAGVEDMANYLLESRGGKRVGKLWAHRFVQRQPDLKTRFNRVYDFQRALCEDPELIGAWFRLVENMRAKYGVLDCDFYNFDETGFMMGVICPAMVVTRADRRGRGKAVQPGNREWATAIACINSEGWSVPPFLVVQGKNHLSNWYTDGGLPLNWVIKPTSNGWTNNKTGLEWLKHFDKHTAARAKGPYRMLVLDGHESHESAEFQEYCKTHNIITLGLPPHSSHLTQPLDVGCFSVLKRAYGRQIETFIKAHINHITKVEFFLAFTAAYKESMTVENCQAGFRGAGLVPFDPQAVLSKLDVKLRTPTPSRPSTANSIPWVSQTPSNPKEALSQTTLVRSRIARHQGSSPTPLFQTVASLAKGTERLAHEMTLLSAEVRTLRAANEALSKRRRAKKARVRQGGALTVEDAQDIIAQKDVDEQVRRDVRAARGSREEGQSSRRRCRTCGKAGHNARTCQEDIDTSSASDST
jgi:DDE superfamily endonuclease/helix-turn-helix, Psq domain